MTSEQPSCFARIGEHEAAGRPAPPGRRGRRVWWWGRRRPPRPRPRPAAAAGGTSASRSRSGPSRPAAGRGSSPPSATRGALGDQDRGGQDRPGKPQNALYAYKVSGGRVGTLAGGPASRRSPCPWRPATGRTSAATARATLGRRHRRQRVRPHRHRPAEGPRARPGRPVRPSAAGHLPLPVPRPAERLRQPQRRGDVPGRRRPLPDRQGRAVDPVPVPGARPRGHRDPGEGGRPGRRGVANLSGADLSTDQALLAVDTHTTLYVYQAADPSLPGAELVADLISRPPAWTVQLAGPARVTNVEAWPSATAASTSTCWPRTATSTTSRPPPTSADLRPPGGGRRGRADPGRRQARAGRPGADDAVDERDAAGLLDRPAAGQRADRDGRPGEHAGDADDPAQQVVGDDLLAQAGGVDVEEDAEAGDGRPSATATRYQLVAASATVSSPSRNSTEGGDAERQPPQRGPPPATAPPPTLPARKRARRGCRWRPAGTWRRPPAGRTRWPRPG